MFTYVLTFLVAGIDDAALIGGILSLVGLVGKGISDWQLNKRQENFATESQTREFAQQEKLLQSEQTYASEPARVERLREAGLNTGLMYGSGGSALSPSAPSVPQRSMPSYRNPFSEPSDLPLQAALSALTAKANILQTDAQTQKIKSEIPYISAQTKKTLNESGLIALQKHGQNIENQIRFKDLQYHNTLLQLDQIAKRAGIENVSAQTKKYLSEEQLNVLQGKFTQTEINSAMFEYNKNKVIWDKCSDYILRGIQEETRGKKFEADKLYYEARQLMYKTGVMDDFGGYFDTDGGPFDINGVITPIVQAACRRYNALNKYSGEVANKLISWWKNK